MARSLSVPSAPHKNSRIHIFSLILNKNQNQTNNNDDNNNNSKTERLLRIVRYP